ncbi:MAG TPA: hypothetical protein VHU86_06785 [Solirubrobacterales bacterium]|nr:hypothetical protein [Solirubrobacterales bacterium]
MKCHAKAPSAGSTFGLSSSSSLFGRAFACLVVLAAFAGSGAPSAGAAVIAKGVNGYFGATGEAGGQLNTPRGTAVNQTSGNVYVADSANNRISVFNSSGTFLRAFGQDVIESGPDNNGTGYEICVAANGDVCKKGITTASTGGAMQEPQGVAIDASGNVYVSEPNKLRVQKFDGNGNFLVAFGRNVVASGPSNGPATAEVQSVTIAAVSGAFTLTFSGQTTSALPYNATANEVEAALNQLSTIGGVGGSVSVSGGPGDGNGTSPYVITFGGGLNGVNAPQITVDQTNLLLAVGAPLTCTTPTNATTKNFQWLRNGAPIGGATSSTYTTVAADQGTSIQCQVFALNATAGLTQTSSPQMIVAPAPAVNSPIPPASIGAPAPGFPKAGTVETCEPGSWSNSPTFTFQWYRSGVAIPGATSNTYTLVAADVPSVIQCAVIGTNAGGAAVLVSANRNTSPAPTGVPSAATPVASASSATTVTEGSSGPEVCTAAAGDVCQVAVAGTEGGEFGSTFNGYLTIAPVGAPNAGNLLVADPANRRVQEFTPAGAFVRAFGFDVKTGGVTTFEVCEVATECKEAGASGAGVGQFATNTPNRIAEDAEGDIYTVEPTTNFRVQKFTLPGNVVTPQGNFSEANLKGTAAASAPLDVTIDPATKDVLVSKGFAAGATPSCPASGAPSVAEQRIVEVSQAGALEATHMACAGINSVNGLAMRSSSSTGDVYVGSTTEASRLYVLNAPIAAPTVTFQGIDGITAHSAKVSGFVNPNGPTFPYGLTTGYHIAFKRSADSTYLNAPAVDVNVGRGTGNLQISQELIGLEANTSYDVRIVATKPFGTGTASTAIFSFNTPAAPPTVSAPGATTAATATGAKAALWGFVNPNSQATVYRFEYGATTAYGAKTPAVDASVGSGAASVPVYSSIANLQPGTAYHFRLVARNVTGVTNGPDRVVTTPAGGGLPDDRGIELVSPPDKRPTGGATNVPIASIQDYYHPSEDGETLGYPILNGLEDSDAGGEAMFAAERKGGGWASKEVTPPSLIPAPTPGLFEARAGAVRYFSPNLECAVIETHNPLTSDTPQVDVENGTYNLYRWDRAADTYTLITNRVPIDPTKRPFGSGVYFNIGGSSEGCSKIFFYSSIYSYSEGGSGLYEWDEGTLRDAGRLPDGSVSSSVNSENVGYEANTVSPESGRLFFVANSDAGKDAGKPAVFARLSSSQTVDASQSATATASQGAKYETASPDGSSVFFLANYGLAATSSVGSTTESCPTNEKSLDDKACDLYRYDVDSGQLADISADANPFDTNGAVAEGVLAVSDSGDVAYFAARGQLVPGKGRTYAQNKTGTGFANIYRWAGGELSYVGSLAPKDVNWGLAPTALVHNPSANSQTSKSGEYLLFVSRDNITGTNPGNVPMAYLYTASSETLDCASCPADVQPIGAGPLGAGEKSILDQKYSSAGFAAYFVPRSLSEDGRAIFASEDELSLGGIAGQGATDGSEKNIYEWHDGQVAALASGSVSVRGGFGGPDGRDIFVQAFGQLNWEDKDFAPDMYDFRAGGGFAEPPPPAEPCNAVAGGCQGTATPAPSAPAPASGDGNGPGNPPPPKAKKKSSKHKHKKGKKNKGHKAKNGKRATNGNRGGAK